MQERLQKIISRAGVASRRAGEELILAGRVRVNGKVVSELGAKADLGEDTIEVDGRRLVPEAARYLALHKPRGVVSTLADPEGRPTVVSLLEGAGTRLYPVGRLDFATSGILLVTNDGDFANGLLHPRGGVPKTYVVKTKGLMTEEDFERWTTGIQLEDGKTAPAELHFLRHEDGKTWFEITLREGRNQQIRRMGEATGFPVMRLARVSFAGITSEGLRPGQWRSLSLDELLELKKQYGVPKKIRGAQIGVQGNAGERRVRRPTATEAERHGPRHERQAEGFHSGAVSTSPKPEGRRAQRSTPAPEAAPRPGRGEARPGRGEARPARGEAPHTRSESPRTGRSEAPRTRGDAPRTTRSDAPRTRSEAPRTTRSDAPRTTRSDASRTRSDAPRTTRSDAPRTRSDATPRARTTTNREHPAAAPQRRR